MIGGSRTGLVRALAAAMMFAGLASGLGPAAAWTAATPWHETEGSRSRLIAATVGEDGKVRVGLQIELEDGWKTYWRAPGDAGGIAPALEWEDSGNLKRARLMFPAPRRFVDSAGQVVGYKHEVVFPFEVEAADPAKPIQFHLAAAFGICNAICVPVDHEWTLELKDTGLEDAGVHTALARALARVPVAASGDDGRPSLVEVKASSASVPMLTVTARYPGGADEADLFVESADGGYVPLPRRVGEPDGDQVRFEVDLGKAEDAGKLSGKELILTLVDARSQSEVRWKVP